MESEKPKCFAELYSSLCFENRIYPLTRIKSYIHGTTLNMPVNLVKLDHWPVMLEALSIDSSLNEICLRKSNSDTNQISQVVAKKEKYIKEHSHPVNDQKSMIAMCRSLEKCVIASKVLHTLKLEYLPLTVNNIKVLIEAICSSCSLNYLSLEGSATDDEKILLICHSLKNTSHVKWLNLSSNNVTLKSLHGITDMLKHQTIRRRAAVWEETLRYRQPILDAYRGITRFTLNHNELGDTGAVLLSETLLDDVWVKAVDLQNCGISDKGAHDILAVAKANCILEIVDLRGNSKISPHVLVYLSAQLNLNSEDKTLEYEWLPLFKDKVQDEQTVQLSVPKMKKSNKRNVAQMNIKGKSDAVNRVESKKCNIAQKNVKEEFYATCIEVEDKCLQTSSVELDTTAGAETSEIKNNKEDRSKLETAENEYLRRKLAKLTAEKKHMERQLKQYQKSTVVDEATINRVKEIFSKFEKFLGMVNEVCSLPTEWKQNKQSYSLSDFFDDQGTHDEINDLFAPLQVVHDKKTSPALSVTSHAAINNSSTNNYLKSDNSLSNKVDKLLQTEQERKTSVVYNDDKTSADYINLNLHHIYTAHINTKKMYQNKMDMLSISEKQRIWKLFAQLKESEIQQRSAIKNKHKLFYVSTNQPYRSNERDMDSVDKHGHTHSHAAKSQKHKAVVPNVESRHLHKKCDTKSSDRNVKSTKLNTMKHYIQSHDEQHKEVVTNSHSKSITDSMNHSSHSSLMHSVKSQTRSQGMSKSSTEDEITNLYSLKNEKNIASLEEVSSSSLSVEIMNNVSLHTFHKENTSSDSSTLRNNIQQKHTSNGSLKQISTYIEPIKRHSSNSRKKHTESSSASITSKVNSASSQNKISHHLEETDTHSEQSYSDEFNDNDNTSNISASSLSSENTVSKNVSAVQSINLLKNKSINDIIPEDSVQNSATMNKIKLVSVMNMSNKSHSVKVGPLSVRSNISDMSSVNSSSAEKLSVNSMSLEESIKSGSSVKQSSVSLKSLEESVKSESSDKQPSAKSAKSFEESVKSAKSFEESIMSAKSSEESVKSAQSFEESVKSQSSSKQSSVNSNSFEESVKSGSSGDQSSVNSKSFEESVNSGKLRSNSESLKKSLASLKKYETVLGDSKHLNETSSTNLKVCDEKSSMKSQDSQKSTNSNSSDKKLIVNVNSERRSSFNSKSFEKILVNLKKSDRKSLADFAEIAKEPTNLNNSKGISVNRNSDKKLAQSSQISDKKHVNVKNLDKSSTVLQHINDLMDAQLSSGDSDPASAPLARPKYKSSLGGSSAASHINANSNHSSDSDSIRLSCITTVSSNSGDTQEALNFLSDSN